MAKLLPIPSDQIYLYSQSFFRGKRKDKKKIATSMYAATSSNYLYNRTQRFLLIRFKRFFEGNVVQKRFQVYLLE